MKNSIIISILKGEASPEQKKQFFEACKTDQSLKDEYIRLKNLWVLSLDDKHHFQEKKVDDFWSQVDTKQRKKLRQVWLVAGRYAAILIVALALFQLVYTFYQQDDIVTVQSFECPPGSINNVRLNDGSTIKLNSDTKVELKQFKNGDVIANLQGEAYFNIIHNEKRTFIVESDGYQVRDLGTIFNIKARPSSDKIITTLIDGIIDLVNRDGEVMKVMAPDEQCIVYKDNGKIASSQISDKRDIAWIDGKLVFIEADIQEVVEKLQNRFGTNIQLIPTETWTDFQLTATFNNESLMEILDIMSYLNEVRYQIDNSQDENNQVYIKLIKN